ncbi:TPA: hypothetical protein EYG84_00350, partial [Candidatus Gracilibacteria bacterium]|nr:hypothetical protein [Candidatus Gracilibacteria bacterium]
MLNVFKKSLFYIGATAAIFAGGVASAAADIDVSIGKTGIEQVVPGGTITYTLNISNLGNNMVVGGSIKDMISNKNIDLLSTSFLYDNQGDYCSVVEDPDPLVALFEGSYIYCDLANIEVGTSRIITYVVPVKNNAVVGEEIKNFATISVDGENNENKNDNRANTSTEIVSSVNVAESDISLTKLVNKSTIQSGETLEYTLIYKNTGS